jgi:type I restriction enzyme M protein
VPNISSIIKNVRNIMRQDRGVSGDAQRLEQLGWLLFLKILDDKDQELELIRDRYQSVIPEKFQWRHWAADAEGITGEELILFIDHPTDGLFATLKNLKAPHAPQRAALVKEVFNGSNNYMKSGYELRKVDSNQLNGFDFNNSDDRHVFGTVYESILVELRDAGNKGEYYTPRAITQLMTQMTAPKLGEKVLDPAAGTGGFLSAAIDYIREKEVRTLDDEAILQKSITGWELKPVSYVLGLTNLILHGLDVPDWHYLDSLKTEYNTIGPKQQVECILANPPFGASIADGVETNFPQSFRCRESADLFVILMIQLLKPGGRCAIVLPDGCITGDGYKRAGGKIPPTLRWPGTQGSVPHAFNEREAFSAEGFDVADDLVPQKREDFFVCGCRFFHDRSVLSRHGCRSNKRGLWGGGPRFQTSPARAFSRSQCGSRLR